MRTSIVLAISVLLAGVASARENVVWDGADGVGHCRTGGWWWSFGDHDNTSHSNFPGTSMTYDSVGAWVAKNNGVMDVVYTLEHSANGYAYYGIGFNFLDPEADAPQTWTSICLEYSLTGTAPVQLQLKNYSELTHDNDYALTLSKAANITKTCFTLDEFMQPGPDRTDNTVFPIDTLMSVMRGIKLEATAGAIPVGKPLVSELKLKRITTLDTFPDSATSLRGGNRTPRPILVQSGKRFWLQDATKESVKIEIYDTRGHLLSSAGLAEGRILSMDPIGSGVYLARIHVRKEVHPQIITIP